MTTVLTRNGLLCLKRKQTDRKVLSLVKIDFDFETFQQEGPLINYVFYGKYIGQA